MTDALLRRSLTVVVRAAHERTELACIQAVASQLGASPHVVHERPFWRALATSLEIASRASTPWCLFIDADVIVRPRALTRIVEEMEAADKPFYMCNFLVLDRGFGGPASAGLHGYTTSMLKRAVPLAESAVRAQRPETHLVNMMKDAGIESIRSREVLGIHDYEQYFKDLYRKGFVRAFKFELRLPYMFRRCNRSGGDEYRFLQRGIVDGILARNAGKSVSLDACEYQQNSDRALQSCGLIEKAPLHEARWSNVAGELIETFQADDLYEANVSWLAPRGYNLSC